MITRHREVLERIIDRMRDGATVIVSGSFGTRATPSERCRFFSIIDLPWQRDADRDANPELQTSIRNGKLQGMGFQHLPIGVERRVERPVSWFTDPTSGLVFTKIGSGRLVLDVMNATSCGLFGLGLPSIDIGML
ncbi:hypothetical protein EDB82DRAFT_507372 [Fusarium venenatum]|uniref:uncharacterized protein n=1 Tax=Fusarium venenatum TaxID=56646 RepID=UPI001D1E1F52|nr:hypothetical protein EDB82DRAFT_507372 [Fusarium venenatum]